MDNLPEDTFALAMYDPEPVNLFFMARFDVVGNQLFDIFGVESMQIESAVDGQVNIFR